VETISYGLPAFKLHGRAVVWFAAWKAHCSIYPLSGGFLEANRDALKGYRRTKGSLHITPEAPVPEALVVRLVRARSRRPRGWRRLGRRAEAQRKSRPGEVPERLCGHECRDGG